MRFSDMASPPSQMYFYEDDYGQMYDDDNTFNIFIDVHNVGASWAKGGMYVTGYDPHMITIDRMDLAPAQGFGGNCFLDVGQAGTGGGSFWESVGFMAGCNGVASGYKYGDDAWGFNVENLGNLWGTVSGQTIEEDAWWKDVSFSYDNAQFGDTNSQFFTMDLGLDYNYNNLNHGRGMLILLAGLSFERFGGIEYVLAPDDYDYPGGEQSTLAFKGYVNAWPQGLDRKNTAFEVTNCYVYSTFAQIPVCIDTDPYSLDDKVCVPREITYKSGNGAPVAVTRVNQENTRHVIYFDFTIKNVGGGEVFDMMQMEVCNPNAPVRLNPTHFNKVYFMDARIGQQHLICNPVRGKGVHLSDSNEGQQVRCQYIIDQPVSRSGYETDLIIELGYGYSDSISRRTTIKRVA